MSRRLLVGALVALATGALAQPPPGGPGGRRPPGGGSRDEGFRMVDAYVVSNLQETLGLSDEEFVKVLPLVKRLQSERRELGEKRRRALRQMRELLQPGGANEAQVAEKLKEVKALEAEEFERLRQNLDAVDAALRPLQQAKFRIMQVEVEQKIREILQEVRQRRRGERPEP